ncbi:MAG TPA: hypothetical protein VEA16_10885 [Vicinamibacterales bacterium]|nr:hypothetical protein [Vicinamibacterales bacterium]
MRSSLRPVDVLDAGDELNVVTLERLERRLGEECGQLRLDIANLRTEMIDRSGDLLKWLLAFFVAQTAALATLLAVFR